MQLIEKEVVLQHPIRNREEKRPGFPKTSLPFDILTYASSSQTHTRVPF